MRDYGLLDSGGRKDTSPKDAKDAKFREDKLTADLRRLSQIRIAQSPQRHKISMIKELCSVQIVITGKI